VYAMSFKKDVSFEDLKKEAENKNTNLAQREFLWERNVSAPKLLNVMIFRQARCLFFSYFTPVQLSNIFHVLLCFLLSSLSAQWSSCPFPDPFSLVLHSSSLKKFLE